MANRKNSARSKSARASKKSARSNAKSKDKDCQ